MRRNLTRRTCFARFVARRTCRDCCSSIFGSPVGVTLSIIDTDSCLDIGSAERHSGKFAVVHGQLKVIEMGSVGLDWT